MEHIPISGDDDQPHEQAHEVTVGVPHLDPTGPTAARLRFTTRVDSFATAGEALNIVEQTVAADATPRHALGAAYAILGRLDDHVMAHLSLYRNGYGDITFEVLAPGQALVTTVTVRRNRHIEVENRIPTRDGAQAGRTPDDRRSRLAESDDWINPEPDQWRDTWSPHLSATCLNTAALPAHQRLRRPTGPGGTAGA